MCRRRSRLAIPFLSGLPTDQQQALDRIFSNTGAGVGSLIGANHLGADWGSLSGMGILFVSAKIFGGAGSFLEQAYSFMLFYVPINGLGAILGLIPFLGGLAGFALWIYSIVLAVFAMMASQRLPGGRAVAAVLLPAAIVAAAGLRALSSSSRQLARRCSKRWALDSCLVVRGGGVLATPSFAYSDGRAGAALP